jgi:hypothetical protein
VTQPDELDQQCAEFAGILQDVVDGTLSVGPRFGVLAARHTRLIAPFDESGDKPVMLPLVRACDDAERPNLFLRVTFTCVMDAEGEYMAVSASTFGLFVKSPMLRRPRPFVRLEYVRDAHPGVPSAHVQLHATSAELAWIHGSAGRPYTEMPELHFPIGGRRFRPSLEDFLIFLHREGLFTDWANPAWRTVLNASQAGWEEKQARATVRRHTKAVVDYLRSLGYEIVAPHTA